MTFEVINTERLILRMITPEGFKYLFENFSEAEIKNQLGLTTDAEFNLEKKKSQGGYVTYDRTILSFVLVLKENNKTIGRSGFHNWYADHNKAEIGYVISKEEYKNKGYMSEALGAILEYGFKSMNLNRVEASTSPTNTASHSLLKKYGFTQEGYLRQHFVRDGKVNDSLIFSLLKEEYEVGNHNKDH